MASATRTQEHDQIRRWAEQRGGIPTIVKGTGGLLRIDFIKGPKSGGREASLEEVSWDKWFEIFDESNLSFLASPEPESKFFKLIAAEGSEGARADRTSEGRGTDGREGRSEGGEWNVVLVTKESDGWRVEMESDGHRKTYRTKADAVHHARELSRQHQPAELIIEKVDGEEDVIHYGNPDEHAPV
jgi:hypothetical protein